MILAILGTTVFFFTFNEQYNDHLTQFNLDQYSKGESVNVILNINPRESNNTIDYFLEVTDNLFKELNYPGFVFGSETSKDGVHSIYSVFLSNDQQLLSQVAIKSELSILEVIENPNWHITNNPIDEQDTLIDYLDHSYYQFDTGLKKEISIKPISQLFSDFPRESGQIIVTFVVDDGQVDAVTRRMSEVYKPFQVNTPIEYLVLVNDVNTFEMYRKSLPLLTIAFGMPYSILWLSVLCVFFISIYVSVQKTKEITISYMHGYSRNRIISKFFIPYILKSSSLFVLTMFVTSLVLADSYGQLYFDYIAHVLPFIGLYITLMIFSVLLTYLWVSYRFSSEILKENKQYGIIFNMVSILRIGIIVVLVVPLLSEWIDIANRYPYLNFYDNNEHLKDGVTVTFSSVNATIENDEEKILNEFKIAVSDQQFGYADFWEYLMMSMHDSLNVHDDFYITRNQITLPKEPFLTVNRKYIEDYTNMDIQSTEKIVVLMPVAFKDKTEHEIIKVQSIGAIEFYHEDYVFAPHGEIGPEIPMSGVLKNPIIIVDRDPVVNRFESNVVDFSGEGILLNFAAQLEAKYPTTFKFATIESSYQRNLSNQNQSLARFIQLVTLYIILIGVFLITSLSVYFTSYGKQIAVTYMNGYGYLKRYFRLFGGLSLVGVVSFVMTYYLLNQTMQFSLPLFLAIVLFTLMLEMLLTSIMIHFFERKNIPMIIKGDN